MAAGLGGYFWWRSLTAPLERATLPTLVQDLKRARSESKGSISVYAFRMHHFLQDAVIGQRWSDIFAQMKRQGAAHRGGSPESASFELPENGFDFPNGSRLKATIHLHREQPVPTRRSDLLRVTHVDFDLSLVDPWSLKNPAKAFPKGSILDAQFQRADTLTALEKWPRLSELTLQYRSDPKQVLAGALTVRLHLVPSAGRHDGGAVVMGYWNSGLEGNRKRLVPWLPLALGASKDTFEHSSGSNQQENPGRNAYSLRRKEPQNAESYIPSPEAMSSLDLGALSSDTESLSISPWPARDLSSLPRFTRLQFLECQSAQAKDLAFIAGLPKLDRLYLSAGTFPSLSALAKLPALTDLTLNGEIGDKRDIQAIAGMKKLKALRIYRHQPLTNELLSAATALPNLEVLWISQSTVSAAALRDLARAPKLKDLLLSFKGASSKDLSQLRLITRVEALRLSSGSFDEPSIQAIASMKSLRHLRIYASNGLGGDRILAFANLPNLRSIEFYQCPGVKDAALMKLKARLGPGFEEEPGQ